MVLGVIFCAYAIAYTACHGYGTQSCCSNQRIDLLLCEQVPYLDHEYATGNAQGKGTESSSHYTQCGNIDESIHRHGGAHAQTKEYGSGIHDAIGCCIEQAVRVISNLLDEVTEHQHSNKADSRWDEYGNYGSNCYWEDNLQDSHILYFLGIGI